MKENIEKVLSKDSKQKSIEAFSQMFTQSRSQEQKCAMFKGVEQIIKTNMFEKGEPRSRRV